MELSTGSAVGANAWQLSARDLHYAWIAPPEGFVGSADLTAELRMSNDKIADRKAIHFEWIAPMSPMSTERQLDQKEMTVAPPLSSEVAEPPVDREGHLWRPLPASLAGGAGARPDHPMRGTFF
jgi:hypothetical protein